MPPPADTLDTHDLAILDHLTEDGRATLQEVADRVGLRRPTVHARVKRMEQDGVLRGYHADVDPHAISAGLCAYVLLTLDCGPDDCMTASSQAADALRGVPEVLEYHTIAGQDDALVKIRARDIRDLERLTTKVVSGAPGVSRIRTLIVLSTAFERPAAPIKKKPREAAVSGRASVRAVKKDL